MEALSPSHPRKLSYPAVFPLVSALLVLSLAGCASGDRAPTIDTLSKRQIELPQEPEVKIDRDKVVSGYRQFLNKAPQDNNYREALRRLADLELESGQDRMAEGSAKGDERKQVDSAIVLYQNYLKNYPSRENSSEVLYQLAKAYDLKGERKLALRTLNRLIEDYPNTPHRDEVQFRRGELYFVLKQFEPAADAYKEALRSGDKSPYYEKALYKYGWSVFKQSEHKKSLKAFFQLLDEKLKQGKFRFNGPALNVSRAEKEIMDDALRVISLAFSYMNGADSVDEFLADLGPREYEALIYEHLGNLFLEKERIGDAAKAYLAYARRYPEDVRSPEFHERAILAYQKGGFASLILPAKENYVNSFGYNSAFWKKHPQSVHDQLRPRLMKHTRDLATHYHAVARKSKKSADFKRAAGWYSRYLEAFPRDKSAASINFLLAECLYDSGQIQQAIPEYEKTAYQYASHKKSAEAGYAALVGYQTLEKRADKSEKAGWQAKAIDSALQFGQRFPKDPRVLAVMSKAAEDLLQLNDYPRPASTAESLLKLPGIKRNSKLLRNGWVILAHSMFEMGQYPEAEKAYYRAVKLYSPKDKQYASLRDRLAASIYKQGENNRSTGALAAAVSQFLRVGKIAPGSKIAATADYDAAAALIQMEKWPQATRVLQDFRSKYPKNHELQQGVTEKLALAYTKGGNKAGAALEIERLAATHSDPKVRQSMLWQSANTYRETGREKDALRAYNKYVKQFPKQMPESMEARFQLANLYRSAGDQKQRFHWLREIVKADQANKASATPRTRDITASAILQLAEPAQAAYQRVRLSYPLKKNLKRKKDLMQQAINAYQKAIEYNVAEVTTAATYQVAELYHNFAESLMKSERPRKLKGDELEQYEILLEEQSFPFEEKAIDIHVTNLSRASEGIYDKWVKRSLAVLAKLQPARYARQEKSEGVLNAIH